MFNLNTFFAMASSQGGEGGSGIWSMLIMMGAIFFIMYFLMIRPQQKRQKEHQNMLASIKKGDHVITSAGMHGMVSEIDEKTFLLQIDNNVRVRFDRTAIAGKKEKESN